MVWLRHDPDFDHRRLAGSALQCIPPERKRLSTRPVSFVVASPFPPRRALPLAGQSRYGIARDSLGLREALAQELPRAASALPVDQHPDSVEHGVRRCHAARILLHHERRSAVHETRVEVGPVRYQREPHGLFQEARVRHCLPLRVAPDARPAGGSGKADPDRTARVGEDDLPGEGPGPEAGQRRALPRPGGDALPGPALHRRRGHAAAERHPGGAQQRDDRASQFVVLPGDPGEIPARDSGAPIMRSRRISRTIASSTSSLPATCANGSGQMTGNLLNR